jgi:hypothetical protein
MVYLDDILITHFNLARHREIVQEVLWQLREHCLFLRPEKCEFEKSMIEYLGVIISHNHVEMDPVKVAGVAACVRTTLSSAQGMETSGEIQSINMGTRIQEQKYYAPSEGIRREERMGIPMLGETLYTNW